MQKVLVVYASRLGATGEIAREVMERLTRRGLEVDLRPTTEAPDVRSYDAVVLGGAIHLRHWDKEAMHFLSRHSTALTGRPLWVFQSGPYGIDPHGRHGQTPQPVTDLCDQIGAEPPKVFAGNLLGKVNNCDEVRSWADQVADQLLSDSVASTV